MNIYEAKLSQDKQFCVYEYLRSNTSKHGVVGTPYYVGKGKLDRVNSKNHRTKPPIDKNNILVSSLMNEADAFQAEMLKIHLNGRIDLNTGCLQNRTDGGEGCVGRKCSEETKTKIALQLTGNTNSVGKIISEETKIKMSIVKKGKIISDETRHNMSKGQNMRWLDEESRRLHGEKSKGRKATEETKAKISKANTGTKNHFFGKKHSDETKRKISETKKRKDVEKSQTP